MSVINIFHEDGEVWLDTEVTERDGLCVGSGDTVEEAIEEARTNLLDALRQLSDQRALLYLRAASGSRRWVLRG